MTVHYEKASEKYNLLTLKSLNPFGGFFSEIPRIHVAIIFDMRGNVIHNFVRSCLKFMTLPPERLWNSRQFENRNPLWISNLRSEQICPRSLRQS